MVPQLSQGEQSVYRGVCGPSVLDFSVGTAAAGQRHNDVENTLYTTSPAGKCGTPGDLENGIK